MDLSHSAQEERFRHTARDWIAELTQQLSEAGADMLGVDGLLLDSDAPDAGHRAYQVLYDRAMTIAGGTSEVQRNIVAQRVLGLPRK